MIPFTKMQAVGNDFVVLSEDVLPPTLNLHDLATAVCDRHTGIGADGLLVVGTRPSADLSMRIFNADGSEDTMCGNGLRCVVAWATARALCEPSGVAITLAGSIPFEATADGLVTLSLPPPAFWPTSVPGMTTVDTGSVHTVGFVPALPDDHRFREQSPALENDPIFPERTSVMWTKVTGENALEIRIWERGVGETLGCGTGACAAAVVAIQSGRASEKSPVAVRSKGGTLTVSWPKTPDAPVLLTGPAEPVFVGIYQPLTTPPDEPINHS